MAAVAQKTFDAVYGVAEAELCNRALARVGAELIKDTLEQTKSARICREVYAATRDEVLRTAFFNFAVKSSRVLEDKNYPHETDNYNFAFFGNDNRDFTGTNDTEATFTVTVGTIDASLVGRIVEGTDVAPGTRVASVTTTEIILDRPTTGAVTAITIKIPLIKVLYVHGDRETMYITLGEFGDRTILCNEYSGEETLPDLTKSLTLEVKYVEQVVDPSSFDPLFQDALVLRLASKIAPVLTQTPNITYSLMNEYGTALRNAFAASSEERVTEEADSYWTERTN